MPELLLSPKERQRLKGEAHRLDPVVLLGAGGLSPAVLREIDRALNAHGLVKVRVPSDDRTERESTYSTVAQQLAAARIVHVGKMLVFYRPKPTPAPELPAGTARTRAAKAPPRAPRGGRDAPAPEQRSRPDRAEVRRTAKPRTPRAGQH